MLLYFIHSCVLCSEFFGHVSNKRLTAVLTSSWFYTFLFVEKSKSLHGIKHWYSQLYDHVYLHSSHRSMLIMCRARKIYRPLHCTLVSWTWSKLFFQKGKSLIWRQEMENSPLNLFFLYEHLCNLTIQSMFLNFRFHLLWLQLLEFDSCYAFSSQNAKISEPGLFSL